MSNNLNFSEMEMMVSGVVLKWFLVAGLGLYSMFAIVVIKQVQIMSESVESEMNAILKVFSLLHFLLTVILLVAAVVIL